MISNHLFSHCCFFVECDASCCFAVLVLICSFSPPQIFSLSVVFGGVFFMSPKAQILSSLEVSQTKRKMLQRDSGSASLGSRKKGVSGCGSRPQTPAQCTAVRHWHAYCLKILLFSHLAVTVS